MWKCGNMKAAKSNIQLGAGHWILSICIFASCAGFAATRTEQIREKLLSKDRDYVFVAMHRGDWRNFPENSKGAILSSIALGADIVELDVQMTKDGRFILNHDAALNRTTTGEGKVSDHTLEEIKQFKMRDSRGKPTDYEILTLEEALELTRGKIIMNIDKFTEHPREILDAVAAVGALKEVLVKSLHDPDDARKFFGPYWKDVESGKLLYMPVIQFCWKKHEKAAHDLPLWLAKEPRKASMYEICVDAPKYAAAFGQVLKAKGAPRLWVNTLWDELDAWHGDKRALLDPEANWGWVLDQGATMIQTDYAAELIVWLMQKGRRNF